MLIKTHYLLLILSLIIFFYGCTSNNSDPLSSNSYLERNDAIVAETPVASISYAEINRMLLGMWDFEFDEDNTDLTISETRNLMANWEVSAFLPPPSSNIVSFDQKTGLLEVEVTITNSTEYDAYDLRLIIYTDDHGIRLRNPDNWTALYDIAGGMPINPFRSYTKDVALRLFEGRGVSHSERLQLYFPSGAPMIKFAIDASFPTNCSEPYSIKDFSCDPLYPNAGSSSIAEVKIYDWQFDVASVSLFCPAITSQQFLSFERVGSVTWRADITNNKSVSSGKYIGVIIATSGDSGLNALYHVVEIEIKQVTGWARTWGSTDYDAVRSVSTDQAGNIFATGSFRGTVDFDTGDAFEERTSINDELDIFLLKYDPIGNLEWVNTWGTRYWGEYGNDLVCDSEGNVIVTGTWVGNPIDLDPGPDEDIHSINGWDSIFISKFDSKGNYVWGKSLGSNVSDYGDVGRGIAVDSLDNIYITGSIRGNIDLNPEGGDQYISAGSYDMFLIKLNSDGEYLWGFGLGSESYDIGFGVSVDLHDDVIMSGSFYNTIDFNPGTGTNECTSNGADDAFILKLDSSGTYKWCRTWGGTETDYGRSVDTDSMRNVFVTGDFVGTVDFNPGSETWEKISNGGNDVFLSKYSSDGDFIWAGTWGTLNWYDDGQRVRIDKKDDVYVTGRVIYTWLDFDPNETEYWVQAVGYDEVYLNKLDNDCNFQWVRTWGGGWIEEYGDRGYGIAIDPDNNVIAGGSFKDRGDFNPGSRVDEFISNGAEDAFIIKFTERGYWDE